MGLTVGYPAPLSYSTCSRSYKTFLMGWEQEVVISTLQASPTLDMMEFASPTDEPSRGRGADCRTYAGASGDDVDFV